MAQSQRRCPLCLSERVIPTHARHWTVIACRECLALVKVIAKPYTEREIGGTSLAQETGYSIADEIEILLEPVTQPTHH
jgi:hypothetical protein